MTFSTSLVAVWYSSDSSRSRGAGLQFAEQPRILHRDDRLVGKGAHQFDLPLGERLDPLPGEGKYADRLALAQQRDAKCCSRPTNTRCFGEGVFGIGGDVSNVTDAALQRCALSDTRATRR